jgi:DNA-binding transcriptional regulator PaaX
MRTKFSKPGTIQKKILLLLTAGLALGLTRSARQQFWILKQIPKEWKKINEKSLNRAIKSLYKSKLVEEKYDCDGTATLVLSEEGKKRTLEFNLDEMKIKKPKKWDGKWRIVMFDIPEKSKGLRNTVRFHIQEMGLIEFQKSVFVHPFPCEKEIEFLIEFYDARKYVRFIVAESIDNELHLKQVFGLL